MGYLVPNLVTDILIYGVVAGIGFSRGAELYASFWYRSEGESLQRVAGLFLLIGMLSAIYHVMVSKTYVDFFEDRIVGAGMQGIQSKTFALRYEQILDISSSRGFLNLESGSGVFLVINTPAGSYKIITNKAKEKAQAVSCINSAKQIVLSCNQYANDFGFLPLNNDDSIPLEKGRPVYVLWQSGYLKNRNIFKYGCAVRRPRQEARFTPQQYAESVFTTRYGYNPYVGYIQGGQVYIHPFGNYVCTPVRLGRIVNPSHKALISDTSRDDAASMDYVRYYSDITTENSSGRSFYCHNSRSNFAFIDGHAEPVAYQNIGLKHNNTGPSSTQYWLWPSYSGPKE